MPNYHSRELRRIVPGLLDQATNDALPANTSLAAVLVPILVATADPRVVFTRRTETLSRHAGEISFPGGLAEEGEDAASAALRETEEELGLAPSDVELAGSLPRVHTRVTGILIVPYVGFLARDPRFTPNADEIADVLEFRLADLVAHGAESEFEHEGRTFQTHVYEVDGHVIWGATARILWSLIELLEGADGRDGVVRPA
ncbi:MAG TPA: CoA pyrophosphatase [Actinomycetota bacterium]